MNEFMWFVAGFLTASFFIGAIFAIAACVSLIFVIARLMNEPRDYADDFTSSVPKGVASKPHAWPPKNTNDGPSPPLAQRGGGDALVDSPTRGDDHPYEDLRAEPVKAKSAQPPLEQGYEAGDAVAFGISELARKNPGLAERYGFVEKPKAER